MKKKIIKKGKIETWVKTQAVTGSILAAYYNEVVAKINKMHKSKTKPSEKQMNKQFGKITQKYAQMIEVQLNKIEMFKFEIDLPKGWNTIKD